jgi:hypothetical protein
MPRPGRVSGGKSKWSGQTGMFVGRCFDGSIEVHPDNTVTQKRGNPFSFRARAQ